MRASPVNLIGGFYADDSRHWSVQDTVNWLPMMAELPGTWTEAKLATPPGLRPYQRIGTGPIRGMHDCEGQRFIVSGRTLYRVTNAGVGIPLGTVPGVGRVSFAHNQHKGGSQVLVTNGAPGGGYVYDTRAQTFERISDAGFPGSLQAAYVDSYLLGVEPFGRFWFHSNLADATDYNTLDRYEAEAAPDRIVGLAVSQFEVIVFGERTAEFWGNVGAATGTFQSKRAVIDRGCASRHTICNLDNSVFWLGDDGIVYRLDGYAARRVSTVPIERAIAGLRWADAFAFTWEDRGHKVYYLTFPDGQTWGFDVVSGLWHRRASYGMDRWRLSHLVNWGGLWYGGDMRDGSLWLLDWNSVHEGDQPLVSERTSPVFADNQSAFTVPRLELVMGVGQPAIAPGAFPPMGPTITGDAPDGVNGGPYSFAYTLTPGDAGGLTAAIVGGELPPGLSLSPSGVIEGTPSAEGIWTWTVRVTDANGLYAEVQDGAEIFEPGIACGAQINFQGGNAFPSVHHVTLGNGMGTVTLRFATGSVPDKFEVWLGGTKALDTGYYGSTSEQSSLNAALASRGLPPETITQRSGSGGTVEQWASGQYDSMTFEKTTPDPVAEVRVYAPMAGTSWIFQLGCPEQEPAT